MTSTPKVRYVLRAQQTRKHACHWPGCGKQVPPAVFMCKTHWFKLPYTLRTALWKAYRPGQEIDCKPSATYVAAAREIQDWIVKAGHGSE